MTAGKCCGTRPCGSSASATRSSPTARVGSRWSRRFPNHELGGYHDRTVRPAHDPAPHQIDQRSPCLLDIAVHGGQRRLAEVGAEDIVMADNAYLARHIDVSAL